MRIKLKILINRTKDIFFSNFLLETCSRCGETGFRERKCDLSLDFPAFGSSVLDGPRSKVYLRDKGYAWASIL